MYSLNKRVVVSGSLAASNAVVGSEGELLSVAGVGLGQLNLSDELLVEENLSNVVGLANDVGLVGQDGRVLADEKMDVVSTALVVSWEDCVELNNTIAVSLLDTTEEGGVQAALATGGDAGVDTHGTAVPDVDKSIGDRSVSVDVEELKVQVDWDTGVFLGDVDTNVLSRDKVGSNGDFRGKTRGGVGTEDDIERGV